MLPILLLAAVGIIGFFIFVVTFNIASQGLLYFSLLVMLGGVAIAVLSISNIGDAEAAPVEIHKHHIYGPNPNLTPVDPTQDWDTVKQDPYFLVFAGIVVALWGFAGCLGCGFARET